MATGNNRKENTFRPKAQPESNPFENQLVVPEERPKNQ